jgi:hypothetical protein
MPTLNVSAQRIERLMHVRSHTLTRATKGAQEAARGLFQNKFYMLVRKVRKVKDKGYLGVRLQAFRHCCVGGPLLPGARARGASARARPPQQAPPYFSHFETTATNMSYTARRWQYESASSCTSCAAPLHERHMLGKRAG